MTTPEKLIIQGKLISQMVSYIWRWADDDENKKGKYAKELKNRFDRGHIGVVRSEALAAEQSSYALETLLTVNARKYLKAKEKQKQKKLAQFTEEQKDAAQLLINVFGEDRVRNLTNYLSPIFEPKAVEMPDNDHNVDFPVYRFHVNPNTFLGTLEDPDMEFRLIFRYIIAYPPSPKFSRATLTRYTLEEWIDNTKEKVFRPENPFIPVTTS